MKQRQESTVLFLCTGNYYRSRYAEILFNSVAGKMSLPWKASSRGLALERGVNNVGPMEVSAVKALEARGLRAVAEFGRFPIQVTAEDFEAAHWIVALKEAEHLPLLQERFPAWAEMVEFWQVDDAPEVLALIEREVMDLAARLIGGGRKRVAPPLETAGEPVVTKQEMPKKSAPVVRLGRETKGRRGKGVTTVSDVPLDEAGLHELATTLKDRCGTGGTVKEGVIEIQGDQRERLAVVLEGMGYKVKRVGG
jgi:protein-tyrosine phosphatase